METLLESSNDAEQGFVHRRGRALLARSGPPAWVCTRYRMVVSMLCLASLILTARVFMGVDHDPAAALGATAGRAARELATSAVGLRGGSSGGRLSNSGVRSNFGGSSLSLSGRGSIGGAAGDGSGLVGLGNDGAVGSVGAASSHRDNLVLYIFSNSDAEYFSNLVFFVREAVEHDLGSEFIIILQQDEVQGLDLPELPAHARYIYHNNDCFDWGTYGWVLTSGVVDVKLYRYFFLINSSVRGPFIPPMLKEDFQWWEPFVSRITASVKLVGSTISCEAAPFDGDSKGSVWRRNPHVQSFVLATDQVGLEVLLRDANVFKCHTSVWNTVYYAELGASNAILTAGYNLGSLMVRYQDVDWQDRRSWDCNTRLSPNGEHYYDGITLEPYEVMFVKVRSFLVTQQISSAMKARKYSFWLHEANQTERVSINDYLRNANKHKVPKILEKIAHGQHCFDVAFYLLKNPDLAIFESELDLWKHFVYFGQFEPRMHRFTCPMDFKRFTSIS